MERSWIWGYGEPLQYESDEGRSLGAQYDYVECSSSIRPKVGVALWIYEAVQGWSVTTLGVGRQRGRNRGVECLRYKHPPAEVNVQPP